MGRPRNHEQAAAQTAELARQPEFQKQDGTPNIHKIAKELNMSRSAVRERLKFSNLDLTPPGLTFPNFPEDDIPIEQIIDLQTKRVEKRLASYDAHTWYNVEVDEPGPIGIVWFGDPHLDDNGCHWPLLRDHIKACKDTPRCYGANIGDTNNNWVGNLMRLYAEQDTSRKTATRLAEWFIFDSGVDWLLWLFGNHDQWNEGAEVLKRIGGHAIAMHDWEARFKLTWPDGREIKIRSAHDFPGNSQWNPAHGPMKEAMWGEEADIYVCGHKHNAFGAFWEVARRNFTANIIRVRGYKFLDSHARRLGLPEQSGGASCLTILRPYCEDPYGRVLMYYDIELGSRVLKMEIDHYEKTHKKGK